MLQKQYFTQQYTILDCDCDANHCLMPGSMLRMAQQISTDHCTSIGLTDEFYVQQGAVFLMAKQELLWKRVPKSGETIVIRTMPENAKRVIYKRVTEIQDSQGRQIGLIDSRWVLVNTETKRIVRRAPEGFANLPFDDSVPFELPVQIKKPLQLTPAGHGVASYTRCDSNGHMNNTRYADVAADAIPLQELDGKFIAGIAISYHHEVPKGERFALEYGKVNDELWYVAGTRNDKCCFESNLLLKPIEKG